MNEKLVMQQMHFLSSSFFHSAELLSEKCLKIELEKGKRDRFELIEEHQAYFYGAIFNSVSYLESFINELFVQLSSGEYFDYDVCETALKQIEEFWKLNIPKTASYSILDKYQILLVICNKPLFNKGLQPYQDVDILIKLRNSLIHYEPEYIESKFKNPDYQPHKFEKCLNSKIQINPFATQLDDFYPIGIISYSCCKWALSSACDFISEFDKKLTKSVS